MWHIVIVFYSTCVLKCDIFKSIHTYTYIMWLIVFYCTCVHFQKYTYIYI